MFGLSSLSVLVAFQPSVPRGGSVAAANLRKWSNFYPFASSTSDSATKDASQAYLSFRYIQRRNSMALACSSWGYLLPGDDIGGLDERPSIFRAQTLTTNNDEWLQGAKEVIL